MSLFYIVYSLNPAQAAQAGLWIYNILGYVSESFNGEG